MNFLASYWSIAWGWSTNQLFDDSERPHCLGWPLLPRFWKRLRGKRSGSWVNATVPVTVEQSRALTLALWGLWEPSPRAFRQMLGVIGVWKRIAGCGTATVLWCVHSGGQIYVEIERTAERQIEVRDSCIHMQLYNTKKWPQIQTCLILCNLTPCLLLYGKKKNQVKIW